MNIAKEHSNDESLWIHSKFLKCYTPFLEIRWYNYDQIIHKLGGGAKHWHEWCILLWSHLGNG